MSAQRSDRQRTVRKAWITEIWSLKMVWPGPQGKSYREAKGPITMRLRRGRPWKEYREVLTGLSRDHNRNSEELHGGLEILLDGLRTQALKVWQQSYDMLIQWWAQWTAPVKKQQAGPNLSSMDRSLALVGSLMEFSRVVDRKCRKQTAQGKETPDT